MFGKVFKKKNRHIETSLIQEFKYPKLGPGELWEVVADSVKEKGGAIITEATVTNITQKDKMIKSVTYVKDNKEITIKADYFI